MNSEKFSESLESVKLASDMALEYYGKPMVVCYSGGKDSDALLRLCLESGAEFEVQHSLTSVDAPETVKHVRSVFAELENRGVKAVVYRPNYKGVPITMWSLIPEMLMPPTRIARYCCNVLKENAVNDSLIVTGVRKSESRSRSSRKAFELRGGTVRDAQRWDYAHAAEVYEESKVYPEVYDCNLIAGMKRGKKAIVNPIVDWSDSDVWDYIGSCKCEVNPLYAQGYGRIGCIGCPMAGKMRYREFARYPGYKRAYLRSFGKMLEAREAKGKASSWKSPEEVMHWWMQDGVLPGQLSFGDVLLGGVA